MIGNYCISKGHVCHITSSILQHVLKCTSSVRMQVANVDTIANNWLSR